MDAIADSDRFTLPHFSPHYSAQVSNFYEAMLWYAKERDRANMEMRVADDI